MDCSLPGSLVHGIFQARIPEWVAIPFSRGSSAQGITPRSPEVQILLFVVIFFFFCCLFVFSELQILYHLSLSHGKMSTNTKQAQKTWVSASGSIFKKRSYF